MAEIKIDLQRAMDNNHLVNVYRADEQIFYTGYVLRLSDTEVVMQNYDSLGLDDGMTLLKLRDVQEVEMQSEDLQMMQARIKLSEKLGLISVANQSLMRLTQPNNWIREILGRSYVEQQVVMLIFFDVNYNFTNLEGMVIKLDSETFTFQVLNKNHFDRRVQETYYYNEVGVIEFLGKDLSQMTRQQKLLLNAPHSDGQMAFKRDDVEKGLATVFANQSLVQIVSNLTNRYFYVGTIKAYNKDQYVLKLVDMNGQFGGYSILRRDSIKELWQSNDYLIYMRQVIQTNRQLQIYRQPVLNDEREFDSETNLMRSVLEQDLVMKRFIRIQLLGQSKTLVGVVAKVDADEITFNCFDDFVLLPGVKIKLSRIGEVAFDYLDVLLSQRQLINKKA